MNALQLYLIPAAAVVTLGSLAAIGPQERRASEPARSPVPPSIQPGGPSESLVAMPARIAPCMRIHPADVQVLTGTLGAGGTTVLYTVPPNKWLMITDIQAMVSNPIAAYTWAEVNSILLPLTLGTSSSVFDWEPASFHSWVGVPVPPGGTVNFSVSGAVTVSVSVTVIGYLVDP